MNLTATQDIAEQVDGVQYLDPLYAPKISHSVSSDGTARITQADAETHVIGMCGQAMIDWLVERE